MVPNPAEQAVQVVLAELHVLGLAVIAHLNVSDQAKELPGPFTPNQPQRLVHSNYLWADPSRALGC